MSLYFEAGNFVTAKPSQDETTEYEFEGSLASRIFGAKGLRNKSAHLYALIADSIKWSEVLSSVIEASGLLRNERQLAPVLALLLTHDLLLSKNGIAANKNHALRVSVERHRTRLQAEFNRARIKAGFATKDAWSHTLEQTFRRPSESKAVFHPPRWVRINALRTTQDLEVQSTFANMEEVPGIHQVTSLHGDAKFSPDEHIPNLIAVSPDSDIMSTNAYKLGNIIPQDKASCFPAYLLDPASINGDIIDACAAPGNKTTHLAALLHEANALSIDSQSRRQRIFACEKDIARSQTLEHMVEKAGAGNLVSILPKQDFLRLNVDDAKWDNVEAILLDPSCSGSGMLDRDDDGLLSKLVLPQTGVNGGASTSHNNSKRGAKRKRAGDRAAESPERIPSLTTTSGGTVPSTQLAEDGGHTSYSEVLTKRLTGLANFQVSMIKHAFSFPHAHKVVYSTCSVYAEENEKAIVDALNSEVAARRGWKVLRRQEQVSGMKKWPVRGDLSAVIQAIETLPKHEDKILDAEEISGACIRCMKGTPHGTMGFFVVGFVRDAKGGESGESSPEPPPEVNDNQVEDEEWRGFDDSDSEAR